MLDNHKKELHIEQVKRKINQEQPNKCYICDFQSTSEAAFKIHAQVSHNQDYNIQKVNSITKSSPLKKSKEHNDLDMDIDTSDILKKKDDEIARLQTVVNELQQKLVAKFTKSSLRERPHPVYADIKVGDIEVVKEVKNKPLATNDKAPITGKRKPYKYQLKLPPSEDTVSLCRHRDTVKVQYFQEFPYKCDMCDKRFTHKGNLIKHMNDHNGISNETMTSKDYDNLKLNKESINKTFKFSEVQSCEICGNVFNSKPALQEHTNT